MELTDIIYYLLVFQSFICLCMAMYYFVQGQLTNTMIFANLGAISGFLGTYFANEGD